MPFITAPAKVNLVKQGIKTDVNRDTMVSFDRSSEFSCRENVPGKIRAELPGSLHQIIICGIERKPTVERVIPGWKLYHLDHQGVIPLFGP